MATEILVNDGGAPARILPYEAAEAISAGEALAAHGDTGKCMLANSATITANPIIGYALTDAASGSIANVVTGHGVILNVQVVASMLSGTPLMMGTSVPGELIQAAQTVGGSPTQAVSIADTNVAGATTAGLWRVQTV